MKMNAAKAQELERKVLEELNLARTEPNAYAQYIEERLDRIVDGNVYTQASDGQKLKLEEGTAGVEEAVEFMRNHEALEPVDEQQPSGMRKAAGAHVKDIGSTGAVSHVGTDKSNPAARLTKAGFWIVKTGENLAYGQKDAREVVVDLLIDDGYRSRGHRLNIMNADFKFVGIVHGEHKKHGTVTCIVFAVDWGKHAIATLREKYGLAEHVPDQQVIDEHNKKLIELSNTPSQFEQEVIDEMNEARTAPKTYAQYVRDRLNLIDDAKKVYTQASDNTKYKLTEGAAVINEAADFLEECEPMQTFRNENFPGMMQAARRHTADIGKTGAVSHIGADKSDPRGRLAESGFWSGKVGENIAYGQKTAREVVVDLLIDDGYKSRGHRLNIMQPLFECVAVSHDRHAKHEVMTCIVFAVNYGEAALAEYRAENEIPDDVSDEVIMDLHIEMHTKKGKGAGASKRSASSKPRSAAPSKGRRPRAVNSENDYRIAN